MAMMGILRYDINSLMLYVSGDHDTDRAMSMTTSKDQIKNNSRFKRALLEPLEIIVGQEPFFTGNSEPTQKWMFDATDNPSLRSIYQCLTVCYHFTTICYIIQ